MKKNIFIAISVATLLIGCAKQPIATVEATDYAMSCDALINEIKEIRTQLSNEENKNLAKNVVGKVMTLGIYSADEEDAIMLRERAKSLQLIYTIKQAKGECRALTKQDVKIDNAVIQTTNEAKETIKNLKK